jgi:hypothetical protein
MRAPALALTLAVFVHGTACSQPADQLTADTLQGDWFLTLDLGATNHTGVLQFEASGDGVVAFVDGGPAPLVIDGASSSSSTPATAAAGS